MMLTTMDEPEQLLSVHDVARRLNCSPMSVHRLINLHKLAAFKIGGNRYRIKASELQRFLDASRVGRPEPAD